MDRNSTVEELVDELTSYARRRKQRVSLGHESAALAALITQKYGYGIAAAANLILGPRASHRVLIELDGCLADIDPKWLTNERKRREARPADLLFRQANEA